MLKEEDVRLARYLFSKGLLDKVRLEKFQRMMSGAENKHCIDIMIDTLEIDEDDISSAISHEFNIPFIQLTEKIVSVSDKAMKDDFVKKYNALPIIRGGVELTVAFVSPPYKDIIETMKKETKAFIAPVAVRRSAFLSVVHQGDEKRFSDYSQLPSKFQIENIDLRARPRDKVYELFNSGRLPNADILIDEIMVRAIKAGATDIYFEPMELEFRIRFNVDGVLIHFVSLPKEMTDNLCNVMRTRGSLNMFDKKKAQDGRYTTQYGPFLFDLRVYTLPTVEGERFSIRIMKKGKQISNINGLGFSEENLDRVRYLHHRPRGLLVVAGTAGGGKSTTVYGILNELRDSQKNLITVENPIEFRLDFASQVQVDVEQKLDYASAMRAVLKQLPDLIFLGEIRDKEAGSAAAEAALTGTMVISTILSSDALSAIPRLVNFGIPHSWLAPILNGIIYQQIVRCVCKSCKEEYKPTKEALESAGLGQLGDLITLYRGRGCEVCGGDGHAGRTAIHEVLVVDEELRDLIYNQASPVKIKETAIKNGFQTIRFDAARKLMAGIISLEEYMRVIG